VQFFRGGPTGRSDAARTLGKSVRDRIYRWRIHRGSCDNLAAR
jgi:hypothetical protein